MILSAGLSPAWQQILVFDEVAAGEVNRAAKVVWCASGKMLNVARGAWSLGAEGITVCPLGGRTGEAIRDEFAADGIPALWIETVSATRVCTTIIERTTGRVTELVENAPSIRPEELDEFESQFSKLAGAATLTVLTGSLPHVEHRGHPTDLYRRLIANGPRAILDVRGPELHLALSERPLLVKPNRAELSTTVGRELENPQQLQAAMHELNTSGAEWVLITAGERNALLTSQTSAWRFTPPKVPVVNPIGCGDCLAAGIAVAIDEGAEMVEAVRFGMAAAADNLSQLLPARLDRDRVNALATRVRVNSVR